MRADMAGTLHRDSSTGNACFAVQRFADGAHRCDDAGRGQWRRVPRTAGGCSDTRDPPRLGSDRVHVAWRRADILRREVAPAEIIDRAAERVQKLLGVRRIGVVDQDDGFPATLVEAGDRGLARHRLRETEGVDECRLFVRVLPEPDPAQRRTERGRVDGDDRPETGGSIGDEHDLLVTAARDLLRDGAHRADATRPVR